MIKKNIFNKSFFSDKSQTQKHNFCFQEFYTRFIFPA